MSLAFAYKHRGGGETHFASWLGTLVDLLGLHSQPTSVRYVAVLVLGCDYKVRSEHRTFVVSK